MYLPAKVRFNEVLDVLSVVLFVFAFVSTLLFALAGVSMFADVPVRPSDPTVVARGWILIASHAIALAWAPVRFAYARLA